MEKLFILLKRGGHLEQVWERIQSVNPVVWVMLAAALLLNFFAGKLAGLLKADEERTRKVTIVLKVGALVLAVAACLVLWM